ncbi:primosomal protein N' [candidate division KSB1 bacterium]|nr:primosomal protein N' [candidate division KSB1 bacterium]
MKSAYAQVVFPLPLNREFTYKIPEEMQTRVLPGSIISAPFRNGLKTGYITGIHHDSPSFALKNISDLLFETPVFDDDLLQLAGWMGDYYFTSVGEILQVMLPVKLNRESVDLITPLGELDKNAKLSELEQKIAEIVHSKGKITPKALRKETGKTRLYHTLDKLKHLGIIKIEQTITTKKAGPKKQIFVRPLLKLSNQKQISVFSNAPVQKELYSYIVKRNSISKIKLAAHFPGTDSSLKSLVDKKLIEKYEKEVTREYLEDEIKEPKILPKLTAAQEIVIEAIRNTTEKSAPVGNSEKEVRDFVFLLHGVTGSGKTRVYQELIRQTLSKGKGVLFLVPEIALTDYFLTELRECFGKQVAVLHSRMSPGERYDSWRSVLSGKKQLVIGPRSAVFAPVKDLSLVIVDEEHDVSYKQHESPPYYHARDIAVYRGRIARATVVLGSATPSMESYYNAKKEKYTLLELRERIDGTLLPEVRFIDLKQKSEKNERGGVSHISRELLSAIEERLKKDEQVLLMQNRRGYSTFIQCNECGYVDTCKNCKISMTFHKKTQKATCHFCGYSTKAPLVCPDCGGSKLWYAGVGTQQVEEVVKEAFPGFKTVRMDLDSTRSKSAHKRIMEGFEKGDSDILVGTQMIAKGFDFGKVNLVGIVSADTGLHMPEFRAAERTFQLLTQAAGRAGRRKERGKVLIQTYHPEHYSLTAAQNHDYNRFYEQESTIRKDLDYPPFGRLILLRFSCEDQAKVEEAAIKTGSCLRRLGYKKNLLGPAPAPIEKIKNRYRWQIFLRSGKTVDPNGRLIKKTAQSAREFFDKLPLNKTVRMTIDVDPVNLM